VRKAIYGALVAFLVAIDAALFIRRRAQRRSRLAASHPAEVETSPAAPATQVKPSAPAAPPTPRPTPLAPDHSSSRSIPVGLVTRYSLLITRHLSFDATLFLLVLIVFLATRFVGLDRWPIYFFTDEAVQSVQAASLIHAGFRDGAGQLFPAFFQNGVYFNLSVSVYAQVIPYLLFGFSVIVTRGVSVLVALSGAAAVGLMLRDIFKVRFWWIGAVFMSITPAFFLHSRTAFETVFGTSLYAWFLYFYLRYRTIKPRSLHFALLFGALTFYSYSPMQAVVVVTGVLLFLSDLRYHWQHRRTAAIGLVLLIIFALPYLRFQSDHPDEAWLHLRILNSYLLDPAKTTADKINDFRDQYTLGISPAYWFGSQLEPDLIRHVMKGYGRLPVIALPFIVIGLIAGLRHFKSSAYRAILIALIVTPLGGALAQIQIYRVLAFIVPATLLASIGLIAILNWLLKRVDYKWLALGSFAVLSIINMAMLNDALSNGPTWFNDYTMGGMQYGGEQIFEAVRQVLQQSPDTQVLVSPTWANGTDQLLYFFLPDEPRVQMGNIDAYKFSKLDLNDRMLLVMTANEYNSTINDPKFANIKVERTLPYPDGTAAFYFVRLTYSPQADQIFAAEDAARRVPVREDVSVDGQTLSVLHSQLDIGEIKNVFDGDTFTLARSLVDNPFFIEMTFPEPRTLTGLSITTATMDFNLRVKLYTDENAPPITFTRNFVDTGPDPTNDLSFDPAPAQPIKKVRIEVTDLRVQGDAHIHIREVKLR
jgi:hypothetical protein